MNKYINVEVAKEYLRHDSFSNPYFRSQACQQAIDVLDTVPAADVVEVIRCKDCKYRFNYSICAYRGDNWFCGYGERKNGG